jgi:hypothetical protein
MELISEWEGAYFHFFFFLSLYCDVMLSHWVSGFHCFEGTGRPHPQVFKAC